MYQAFDQADRDAKTVLIVEDQIEMRAINAMYLHHYGFRVLATDNGLEGLEAARKTHPDVILMDIELPGLDGLEATRRLKADATTRAIPVLALTAYAMRGDEERARAAGCDGYLTKPIDRQTLLDAVACCISPQTEATL